MQFKEPSGISPINPESNINEQFKFKDILDFIARMFDEDTSFTLYNESGEIVFNFIVFVRNYEEKEKSFQLESASGSNINGQVNFETKRGEYVDS